MKTILFLLFSSLFYFIQAQPYIEWENNYGGSDEDFQPGITACGDGNYFLTGFTASTDHDVTAPIGDNDVWLVKIDVLGNILWEKSYGGTLSDATTRENIVRTTDGNFILFASTWSDDYAADVVIQGMSDIYIIKIDPDGNIIWQKNYGGSKIDGASHIQATGDGGCILIADSYSDDGDVGNHHGTTDFTDVWILKLDADGDIEWQKSYGGSRSDFAGFIEPTRDNCYIFCCYSFSTNGDVTTHHGGAAASDAWVVKIDSIGDILWEKSYGGSIGYEAGRCIRELADNNFLMFGFAGSPGGDGDVSSSYGQNDTWLVKLDSLGNLLWDNSYGGSQYEDGASFIIDLDGNYVFTAISRSTDFDLTTHCGPIDLVNYDYWVFKTDTAGTLLWQKSFGGPLADQADNLVQTDINQYIVAGFGSGVGCEQSDNYGITDFWIVKLNVCDTIKIDSVPGDAIVCMNSDTSFSVDASGTGLSYQWYLNGELLAGETNSSIEIITMSDADTGEYYCEIYGDCDTVSTAGFNVTIEDCQISISDEINNSAEIYPNPSNGNFQIELNSIQNILIEVFDLNGRLQAENKTHGKLIDLNLRYLSPGLYEVKITGDNYSTSGRIIIY